MLHLHFKVFQVFLTIYMHQFGWLSERGGNLFNLLQKREYGVPSEKGRWWGVPTLDETMTLLLTLISNVSIVK